MDRITTGITTGTTNTTRKTTRRPAAPKLARGQGSCFYDPRDGRCVLEHRLGGKVWRERGESWPEVEELRDARRAEVGRRSSLADAGTTTVADALEQWLELDAPVGDDGKPIAPGTLGNMRINVRTLSASAIGDIPLRDLRVRDVEGVWVTLAKRKVRPMSRSTLQKLRSHLSQAIDRAVRLELVDTNVARASKIPATARSKRAVVWLDRPAFLAVREELAGEDASNYERALLVSLLTGCRPGEALGLRWSAVDLDARTIEVRSGLQADETGRKHVVVDELKTASSRRVLELPADLARALEMERSAQRRRRMASREWLDSSLVFTSDTGRHLNPSNLRRSARRVCESLDIPTVTPNQLRHTFASVMLDLGLSLPAVARAMGHTDQRMVSTTYGHAMDEVVPTGSALDSLVV